jgi:CheY-like chemotaxis protein
MRPPMPDTQRGARVLVVDDEPLNITVMSVLLAQAGYVVGAAACGTEALARLAEAQTDGRIDLVLLDLCMPDMDGFVFLERLAVLADPPPVIVMSGDASGDNIARCRALGCVGFLEKPCQLPALLAGIAQALSG